MKFAQIKDLMYYVITNIEEIQMNTIIAFFKDIFSLNENDNVKVGLSQFKKSERKSPAEQNVISRPGEIKLSDLMRKSY